MAGGGNEMPMETQKTIAESSIFPGLRFSPTDEELVSFYLKNKIEGSESTVQIIPEIDLCKFEPWDLPDKSVIKSDSEWFFFSSHGRKYPNGSQSKRATEVGYWKATGKERNVKSGSRVIGSKRTLVFHVGRAPRGERTEWIIHEYCMHGQSQDSLVVCRLKKNLDFHLTDTPNQNSLNQKSAPVIKISNSLATEAGINDMGCSSSHGDSFSAEQIDSSSEPWQKLPNESSQAECSRSNKDDDDCYAEILKNDIIKLDKSLVTPPDHLLMVANKYGVRRKSKQPMETSRTQPFQGTANRRLRLRIRESRNYHTEGWAANLEKKVATPNVKQQPKSSVFSVRRMLGSQLICMVLVILALLVLFLALSKEQVKRFIYATFF